MKKSDITYILCAAFMSLTSLFYCCAIWFSIKLPRYYPLEHTWKWIKEEGVPSQGWYAMQVFAYLTAGIVTFIIYLVLKRIVSEQTSLKPAYIRLLGLVVTLMVIICLGYTMYHEFEEWVF
jgi:hypothetical protein